ncbi:uncharacterized protein LOC111549888 [Piliocolobus tephrosceles]|uniref:uncharacterized protein LOC111549888 n=1 Tax=Piliocolobus tephrosceles TaxID=591936 RepID=UPI000C29E4D6|nr:uncharacterized protein LOC111549888 [Piliocolobus tephrosceles]
MKNMDPHPCTFAQLSSYQIQNSPCFSKSLTCINSLPYSGIQVVELKDKSILGWLCPISLVQLYPHWKPGSCQQLSPHISFYVCYLSLGSGNYFLPFPLLT